jgi:hypothetical protein
VENQIRTTSPTTTQPQQCGYREPIKHTSTIILASRRTERKKRHHQKEEEVKNHVDTKKSTEHVQDTRGRERKYITNIDFNFGTIKFTVRSTSLIADNLLWRPVIIRQLVNLLAAQWTSIKK